MTAYIALLRGINVGGTGLLPMKDLIALCTASGFTSVQTYIQSGNVLFDADGTEAAVRDALEQALHAQMGRPIDVMVRTAAELRAVLEANPFPSGEPNKVQVAFLAEPPPAEAHDTMGLAGEQVLNGTRELYIHYPEGMGKSKLKLPLGKLSATLRNMNTVAKLVTLSEARPVTQAVL